MKLHFSNPVITLYGFSLNFSSLVFIENFSDSFIIIYILTISKHFQRYHKYNYLLKSTTLVGSSNEIAYKNIMHTFMVFEMVLKTSNDDQKLMN